MSLFGGFQIGPFQQPGFQQGNLVVLPGPSTILFPPSNKQVYELSGYNITISYFDINGNPYIPQSVSWRIWDATNLIQIQDWTAIGVPTSSDIVSVSPTDNLIVNASNLVELREIIFLIVAPGGAFRYDTDIYSVLFLPDIS